MTQDEKLDKIIEILTNLTKERPKRQTRTMLESALDQFILGTIGFDPENPTIKMSRQTAFEHVIIQFPWVTKKQVMDSIRRTHNPKETQIKIQGTRIRSFMGIYIK